MEFRRRLLATFGALAVVVGFGLVAAQPASAAVCDYPEYNNNWCRSLAQLGGGSSLAGRGAGASINLYSAFDIPNINDDFISLNLGVVAESPEYWIEAGIVSGSYMSHPVPERRIYYAYQTVGHGSAWLFEQSKAPTGKDIPVTIHDTGQSWSIRISSLSANPDAWSGNASLARVGFRASGTRGVACGAASHLFYWRGSDNAQINSWTNALRNTEPPSNYYKRMSAQWYRFSIGTSSWPC